jgi:hypothetical protein
MHFIEPITESEFSRAALYKHKMMNTRKSIDPREDWILQLHHLVMLTGSIFTYQEQD